uniref:Carboxylic ester hydrolase n=1 Tax=Panagrolaimus sp. PS1159 TaxID=55785 RepID=A0AC35GJM7_9BILA
MFKQIFTGVILIIILTTTIASQKLNKDNSVFAETIYGPNEGFRHKTRNGIESNVFLGIPYAKPPIKGLRFERPIPPQKWNETLQTKQFQPSCIPYNWQSVQNKDFSEDCLYLNIIAPTVPSEDLEGYPVLVYIHGGGFVFGDVVKCGFDKATDNFARRGLITVTVPYRLGLYGFMSLGTAEDPGNIGLWDQIAALKFIKENIKYFGGNPNNIIVWGESAGSASVDLLSLSPHSRDLFQKVIQGSGCGINEFANSQPVTRVTKQLAKALGCNGTMPSEIKECLKNQTWYSIMNVSSTQFIPDKAYPNYIGFGPRYDKDFFDGKTVEQLIKEAPPKPLIVGLMTLEGAAFTGLTGSSPEDLAKFSAKNITEAIRKSFAPESIVGPEFEEIQKDLINYFVYQNAPEKPVSDFYIKRYADLWSDFLINQEVFNETDLKVKNGWPVYFYLWNHMSSPVQATLPAAKGAWHATELYYTFDQKTFSEDVHGEAEYKVQNYYANIFAKFAYTGMPNTTEIKFPQYNLETKESLWIDPILSINKGFLNDRRKFWEKHIEKFKFNILRGRTRQEIINGSSLD